MSSLSLESSDPGRSQMMLSHPAGAHWWCLALQTGLLLSKDQINHYDANYSPSQTHLRYLGLWGLRPLDPSARRDKISYGPSARTRLSSPLREKISAVFPQLTQKCGTCIRTARQPEPTFLDVKILFITSGAHWRWLCGASVSSSDCFLSSHLFIPHWLHSAFYPCPPTKATYIIYVGILAFC